MGKATKTSPSTYTIDAKGRILELNPENPAVEAVRELHGSNAADPRLESYMRLLYEQAVIAEGSKVADASAFAKRINELIARDGKAISS